LRIRVYFFRRQRRARRAAPGRIADHPGKVSDHEHDLVATVLELAHLVQKYRMAEVQVGRCGIKAGLDHERAAELETRVQLIAFEDVRSAPRKFGEIGMWAVVRRHYTVI
jgi:hypothetical protein